MALADGEASPHQLLYHPGLDVAALQPDGHFQDGPGMSLCRQRPDSALPSGHTDVRKPTAPQEDGWPLPGFDLPSRRKVPVAP